MEYWVPLNITATPNHVLKYIIVSWLLLLQKHASVRSISLSQSDGCYFRNKLVARLFGGLDPEQFTVEIALVEKQKWSMVESEYLPLGGPGTSMTRITGYSMCSFRPTYKSHHELITSTPCGWRRICRLKVALNGEVLQTEFRFHFRKGPRQISAGPGWSTP